MSPNFTAQRWDHRMDDQRLAKRAMLENLGKPKRKHVTVKALRKDGGFVDALPRYAMDVSALTTAVNNFGTYLSNASTAIQQWGTATPQTYTPTYAPMFVSGTTHWTVNNQPQAPLNTLLSFPGVDMHDAEAVKAAIEHWWAQHHPEPTPDMLVPKRLPPPLAFNRYINASDLLEEFIGFLGTEGVRKSAVLDIPIELFIKYVIVKACELDNEEPNVELALPAPKSARCLVCQRFMRPAPVMLDRAECFGKYQRQLQAAA